MRREKVPGRDGRARRGHRERGAIPRLPVGPVEARLADEMPRHVVQRMLDARLHEIGLHLSPVERGREVILRPYGSFYRVEDSAAWIVAVWHGARLAERPPS